MTPNPPPPPPLDAWPAIDDVLLKLAVESGVALEALTGEHACVEFSKKWSLAQVSARWRAMLYDAAFSRACVARCDALDRRVVEEAIEARCDAGGAPLSEILKSAGFEAASARLECATGDEEEDEKDGTHTPRFAEVEQAILRSDLVSAVANGKDGEGAGKAPRGRDGGALRKIEALERSAQAASARLATAKGALAELVGTYTTFAIDKNEVVIGRSTEDLKVDIDLSLEGNATKISRQQAFLKLRWNGEFALRNVGRRPIWCNNAPITTGQRCVLAPHTLIEVGGMRLLFVPNPTLIRDAAPEGV